MDKKFTSDEVPLAQLLDQARTGVLQLPDFQRGWVWDDNAIRSLLASISLSYPIGAVMTLQTGNPEVKFRPRLLEGVELTKAVDPEILLLDGQQRATSLYLVLRSGQPVWTKDPRKNDILRRYYVDIKASLDPTFDREDAILSVPADGLIKSFGKEVTLDVSTRKAEIAAEMFPLGIVLDFAETMSWMLEYLSAGPGGEVDRLEMWKGFNEAIINPFVQYQVPTIQLIKATPKEAVCQVFEKVNTGGVDLTVFELLTATYAADDFNLRDDWKGRQKRLSAYGVLDRFAATDFLQVVTLLATHARREKHLEANADGSSGPPVSCKRRDVLRLSLEDYKAWSELATKALERAVTFLHGEHIFTGRDVPYATQLVPLAAVMARLRSKAESFGVREMLRRWLWCGVFGEMYGGSTETRFAYDMQDVLAWVDGDDQEPRTVRDAQFQADRLLSLFSRQSAAYKGLYAMQMKRGGRDFRTGTTIDVHAYADDAIEIHHIFPRSWCQSHKISAWLADSVVNKTAIDAYTNRYIGGSAPSIYLAVIENHDKIAPVDLDAILRSHDIDPITLRSDDFEAFFSRRFERLLKQIEEAMGKPVNRIAGGTDNPFHTPEPHIDPEEAIRVLLKGGETKVVEFKSTGRLNLHTNEKDPNVEWAVLKSIAGFANAYGGTLLVGAADDGTIVGVERDFPLVKGGDSDGWELWLTDAVSASMGKVLAADLEVTNQVIDGLTVVRIEVGPSPKPVFATKDKKPAFMVRINNSTQELTGQEMLDYKHTRWP
ncbi:MAG: GmrSD restriction endonuclease domain-containing protein [Acidimicrobiales bacterium]